MQSPAMDGALSCGAQPNEDVTAMVVHVPAAIDGAVPEEAAFGSRRTEADRKRQRDYQAAHLKKKKEDAEAAAHELTVLRNERALIAQSLISALPPADRPAPMQPFNLLTIAQVVAGNLILSRCAGPSITGACAPTMPHASAVSTSDPPQPSQADPMVSAFDGREDMARIREVLTRMGLAIYADQFEDQGYDDFEYLIKMSEQGQLARVADDVNMKPGHKAKFVQRGFHAQC